LLTFALPDPGGGGGGGGGGGVPARIPEGSLRALVPFFPFFSFFSPSFFFVSFFLLLPLFPARWDYAENIHALRSGVCE